MGQMVFFGIFFTLFFCATHIPALKNNNHEVAERIRGQIGNVLIDSHRSKGFDNAPENSRESIRKAVSASTPIIETDLRLTKDGRIIILHDEKIDRTTSGKGYIKNMSGEDLLCVTLKNGEKIPYFEEIYDITRGKSILDIDFKVNIVSVVAEWIAQYGSFDDFIFFVNEESEMKEAARMKKKYTDMMIRVSIGSGKDFAFVKDIFKETFPEIVTIDIPRRNVVRFFHARNVKVFVPAYYITRFFPMFAKEFIFRLMARLYRLDILQVDHVPKNNNKWRNR